MDIFIPKNLNENFVNLWLVIGGEQKHNITQQNLDEYQFLYDKNIVQDITKNLFNQGFTKVGVLNFHAGNLVLKLALRDVNLSSDTGVAVLCQPWQDIDEESKTILDNYGNEQHAGEFETSVMMHIDPAKVGSNLIDCVPEVQPTYFDYQYMKEYCPDGVWGKATLANSDKGRLLFDAMVKATVEKLASTFDQLNSD